MKINPSIFKAYDIRGIYPNDINEEIIKKITRAIYYFFAKTLKKSSLKIVLGYDMRLSSPPLYQSVRDTLVNLGTTVIDIGMVPTPTVYFYSLFAKADAGIQISASHNPPQWNGLKFFYCQGNKIYKASRELGMEEVKKLVTEKTDLLKNIPQRKGRIIKVKEALQKEMELAVNIVKPKIKKLKIAVDPANTMGILMFDQLWKKIPANVIKLNYDLDGNMPSHEANPLKFETLKELQKTVIDKKADLGIATDGDADRVFFIDENGEIIPSTLISSLITEDILKKEPNNKILCDVRYVNNVKNIVAKFKGEFILAPVGHALITKSLNENQAAFCGESSGHYYFRETGGAESTIRVILTILHLLSTTKKSLSQLVKEIKSSFESGEYNYHLTSNLTLQDIFNSLKEKFADDGKVIFLDGLTIEYPSWRFNIRGSNTEPLIRLNVEADNKKTLENKLKNLQLFFGKLGLKKA